MSWFKKNRAAPMEETTLDRRALLEIQKKKLRQAQTLAATMRQHDRINHYQQRLRRAYVLALAQEGEK